MYYMLDNLIGYMKTYLRQGHIDMKEIRIHQLLEEKKAVFAPVALSLSSTIINLADEGLVIRSNASLLGVVIHNLVDNAVKHTRNGQITLWAGIKDDIKLKIPEWVFVLRHWNG
jgi:signal transduction histidine kinase